MENEDINFNIPSKYHLVLGLVIGLLLGLSIGFYLDSKERYRTPSELADYIEEILYEHKHIEELAHAKFGFLISMDTTTIGEMKQWYSMYSVNGSNQASRYLLERQLEDLCYREVWK